MPKNPKPEPDDKEQSERFIETARQLKVDESGKPFELAISIVAKIATDSPPKKQSVKQ